MANRQPIQQDLFAQPETKPEATATLANPKLCLNCMLVKDRTEFVKAYCRPCTAEVHKSWRKGVRRPKDTGLGFFDKCRHCELFFPKSERYTQNVCRFCGPKAGQVRYQSRSKTLIAKQGAADRKRRRAIFEAYGNRCACCSEHRYELLTIDHVHGGGLAQHKELGGNRAFERWLEKNGCPKGDYQLLCWNCNVARFQLGCGKNGECPHKVPLEGITAALFPILPDANIPDHLRRCITCNVVKNLEEDFYKNRDTKNGTFRYRTSCKDCIQNEFKNPSPRMPDEPAGIGFLKRCSVCELWQIGQEEFSSARNKPDDLHGQCSNCGRIKNLRIRVETINAYGGKCECCGIKNWRFLHIDHIHGDGAEERRQGKGAGSFFYRQLKELGYPRDRYRVLCVNCNNCIARHGGICVHQQEKNS